MRPATAYLRVTTLYALLWWILARGDARSLVFGTLVLVGAVAALRAPGTPADERIRVRWRRLPRFVAFFVVHSLRGGVDVARRALRRRIDVAPAFMQAQLHVIGEAPRALVALTVSLLPGTLTTHLAESSLTVHALDARGPIQREVARVQEEVAALFGQSFPGPGQSPP